MQVDHLKWYNISTAPPFSYDQIIGVDAVVFSDETKPEVFNFTRLSGERDQTRPSFMKSRSGGYLEVWRYNPSPAYYPLYLKMDRITCPRPSWDGGGCQSGQLRDGFFAADDATFPGRPNRRFSNTAKTRGAVKIDYLCTNCGASTVNTMWVDLGSWNMQTVKSKTFNIDAYNIPPSSIVGMSSAIQSDPNASGKVEVDNLEHVTANGSVLIQGRMRGGTLWWGYGCGTDSPLWGNCRENSNPTYSTYKLIVYRGPTQNGQRHGYSNYAATPGSTYWVIGPDGITPIETREIRYSGTGRRGWVKIEYTGAKSTTAVPYTMKTRALPLGAWSMTQSNHHAIDFNALKIAANRITSIYTGILSDKACVGDGRKATNFHRPLHSSGHDQDWPDNLAGGVTFVDEKDGKIRFLQYNRGAQGNGYYQTCRDGDVDNRGFVKMDILDGSCPQGPAGFKIQGVPGTDVGTCTGTSQPFAIEGAGRGTPAASFNTVDSLTYVYKSSTAANLTVSVRVESFDANAHASALAGIMFRGYLNASSRNAALMALPGSGGVSFRRRTSESSPNNATVATGSTASVTPCWLRIQKIGNSVKAWRHSSTSTTMPTSGWTQVGPTVTLTFPSTYYYGLQVSNFDSPKLTKVTMRNLTVQ